MGATGTGVGRVVQAGSRSGVRIMKERKRENLEKREEMAFPGFMDFLKHSFRDYAWATMQFAESSLLTSG